MCHPAIPLDTYMQCLMEKDQSIISSHLLLDPSTSLIQARGELEKVGPCNTTVTPLYQHCNTTVPSLFPSLFFFPVLFPS